MREFRDAVREAAGPDKVFGSDGALFTLDPDRTENLNILREFYA